TQRTRITHGDLRFDGEVAEVSDRGGLRRAEFYLLPDESLAQIDEDFAIQTMQEYAQYNGLLYCEYAYKEDDRGRIATLRGIKSLTDPHGVSRPITFVGHTYYGDSSVLAIVVAAPSDMYPTAAIAEFLLSVRRKP